METKYSAEPAGGEPSWSRELAGRSVKSLDGPAKSTTCTVGAPAYICCLSSAHTCGEMYEAPAA